MNLDQWSTGISSELSFWTNWLNTKGLQWPADYAARTNPDTPLADNIAGLFPEFGAGKTLKVLDVGAGPMSVLGKKLNGHAIDLTAVDALANLYDELNFPVGLPLVRTKQCHSEKLTSMFDYNTFDLTFACNTLDHGYDPMLAVREMIAVTKPGGFIVTQHNANEALNENWGGFHQWNFSVQNNDLIVSNRTKSYSTKAVVGGAASYTSLSPDGSSYIFCVLKKSA